MRITREACPVCGAPEMRVEHGIKDPRGRFVHLESCQECGEHEPIVGYECKHCIQTSQEHKRIQDRLKGASL